MAQYEFVTLWQIEAPIEKVWNAIFQLEEWPLWWSTLDSVTEQKQGNAIGLGAISHFVWHIPFGRTIGFDGQVVKIEDLRSLAIANRGELEGRWIWEFSEIDAGTIVRLTWTVQRQGSLIEQLLWQWQPLLTWNHRAVMQQGAIGLSQFLGSTVSELRHSIIRRSKFEHSRWA